MDISPSLRQAAGSAIMIAVQYMMIRVMAVFSLINELYRIITENNY